MVSKEAFGKINGKKVALYRVEFPGKLVASITNYGGALTSLKVPDRNGLLEEVVLGFDKLEDYVNQSSYLGVLVGRYANRIADGRFSLDGKSYDLKKNNEPNHLHGGPQGFNQVVWDVLEVKESPEKVSMTLKYVSKDGEEGYPGTLETIVTYDFTEDGFHITYQATTNQKTIVNLTQHSYFNLSGDLKEGILEHELQLMADHFIPINEVAIPLGKLAGVKNTPFDFSSPVLVGARIEDEDQQLVYGKGYDHCWALDGGKTSELKKAGCLTHAKSGRLMEVYTTEPGIQLYSGNFLNKDIIGSEGRALGCRMGLCLETQHYPDSPNRADFPSVVLDVGQTYLSETKYQFGLIN